MSTLSPSELAVFIDLALRSLQAILLILQEVHPSKTVFTKSFAIVAADRLDQMQAQSCYVGSSRALRDGRTLLEMSHLQNSVNNDTHMAQQLNKKFATTKR